MIGSLRIYLVNTPRSDSADGLINGGSFNLPPAVKVGICGCAVACAAVIRGWTCYLALREHLLKTASSWGLSLMNDSKRAAPFDNTCTRCVCVCVRE